MNKLRFESLPAAGYYFGCVFAGIATVLAGPLLPTLSTRLSLNDTQAGAIFTAQFAAAIVGAILSSQFRRQAVVLGYLAMAVGMAAMTVGSYTAVLTGFALVGLGIGSAVTATNLIFGTAYPQQRAVLLARVNVFWGAGAILCPQLVAAAEHLHRVPTFTAILCITGVLVSILLSPLLRPAPQALLTDTAHSGPITAAIFCVFSLTLALYIGIETALAGWVATYAHRFAALTSTQASMLVSAFWLSILCGRLLLPLSLRLLSELAVTMLALGCILGGITLLLAPHTILYGLPAVALCGIGCAPIYPITVARLLARIGPSRHAGWLFALCGCGGAVLPWTMGLVSTHMHSLRAAFAVPVAAVFAMLLLMLLERLLPAAPVTSK